MNRDGGSIEGTGHSVWTADEECLDLCAALLLHLQSNRMVGVMHIAMRTFVM